MPIVTNTSLTFNAIGIREDLDDVVYNIAPTETPFSSGIKRGKADNVLFEWLQDTLAAHGANAQLEGDDLTSFTAVAQPTRLTNRTQILRKEMIIADTQGAVNSAGNVTTVPYQVAKRMKELKRDIEFALCQNSTAVTGNATTARQTRGLDGFMATNNNLGAGGAAPSVTGNTAPTLGTQRVLTEDLLKDVIQKCYVSGGSPDMIMLGPVNRQRLSGFAGNATRTIDATDRKLVNTIRVYASDFGDLKVMPNRFQAERTGFVLDMSQFEMAVLRPTKVVELAKTGDAEKRMLITELGLKCAAENASGAIRDLTTT